MGTQVGDWAASDLALHPSASFLLPALTFSGSSRIWPKELTDCPPMKAQLRGKVLSWQENMVDVQVWISWFEVLLPPFT